MTDLITREFGIHGVRILVRDGDPWFVANDVARVLDVGNSSDLVAALDDDEKGVEGLATPGGSQSLRVVSESGLYSIILRSRKPDAKVFKRWVTHEVLPSIRKTGSYTAGTASLARRISTDRSCRDRRGHVYVIGFSTGVVKVGQTTSPKRRVATYRADAARFDAAVERVWVSPAIETFLECERALIKQCSAVVPPHSGSEYFRLDFDHAVSIAQRAAA